MRSTKVAINDPYWLSLLANVAVATNEEYIEDTIIGGKYKTRVIYTGKKEDSIPIGMED